MGPSMTLACDEEVKLFVTFNLSSFFCLGLLLSMEVKIAIGVYTSFIQI